MISATLGQVLNETATKFPEHDALVYINKNIRNTYREFNEQCNQLARGLLGLGIKKGDHIAVWAYNLPEWVYLQFASAKIGAVLVTVNTYYKAHELQYLLKQSDATTLFLARGFKDVDYVEIIKTLLPELSESEPGNLSTSKLPYLKNIVSLDDQHRPGMFTFNEIKSLSDTVSLNALKEREASLDPNETINMQYTSGTTGFPKGVMLTHQNIVNNAHAVGDIMYLTERDRMCIPVPFFHCFGCVLSTTNCVVHGSAMIPIEIFNAGQVLDAVEAENCTALQGVPTMFIAELQHPEFNTYDLTSLRTGIMAGAPCPIELMINVIKKMHMNEITICYGLTEASPVLTQTRRNDTITKRVETVGKPLPGVEVKIVDKETDEDVPPNTPGELVARGYNIMKGYYKMPDQTDQVIRDGWLHTRDLAVMDSEGYFSILGRVDDMIIRGGENVYPREIEEFLFTHDSIRDVAVVGVPNEKYGEEVCAFIQLKNQPDISEMEIQEFCKKGISRFKIPKYVFFTEEFPMTASGKIRKVELREMAQHLVKQRNP
jgi:fatty-acyl-CoA synthase